MVYDSKNCRRKPNKIVTNYLGFGTRLRDWKQTESKVYLATRSDTNLGSIWLLVPRVRARPWCRLAPAGRGTGQPGTRAETSSRGSPRNSPRLVVVSAWPRHLRTV